MSQNTLKIVIFHLFAEKYFHAINQFEPKLCIMAISEIFKGYRL